MGITSIRMNLDFLFNAAKAEKGFGTVRKSFTKMGDVSQAMEASLKQNGLTVNKLSGDFTQIKDILKDVGSSFQGIAGDLLNFAGTSDETSMVTSALEKLHTGTMKVMSGMKGLSNENAAFVTMQTLGKVMEDAGTSAKTLGDMYKKLGLEFNESEITANLVKLGAESDKAFQGFNTAMKDASELMSGLNGKQLGQYRQKMQELDAAYKDGTVGVKEYTRELKRLNYTTDIMNNKLPKMGQQFKSLFSGASGSMLSTIGAMSVLDDALGAQQQTVETTHRLSLRNQGIFQGQTNDAADFGSTVSKMNQSILDVGTATSVSMKQAASAMNALASARVPGTIEDLEAMTITSVRMSQAFGMAEGQSAELIKSLTLAGGLKPDGVEAVGEALADTQAVWGMTLEEATEAGSTVGMVISRMASLGPITKKNAAIAAKAISTMTVTFTRAGLSAQDATTMIDRFMDPGKLEDNALLWHNMGMSVSDGLAMMSGDASAMEGMNKKLGQSMLDLKKRYAGQPLAFGAMAEAMGVSVSMANQLADSYERDMSMSEEDIAKLEKEATLQKQAEQARKSAAEALQRLAAIGNVFIQTLVMPILDIITPIITFLGDVASWISKLLDKIPVLGKAIKMAFGAFLLLTIMTRINVFKMLKPFDLLGKGASKAFSIMKKGASAALKGIGALAAKGAEKLGNKGVFGKALGGISDKIGGIGKEKPKFNGVPQQGKDIESKMKDPKAKQGSTFLKDLAKVPPQVILAIAVAILALGVAIGVVALSFAVLAKALKELDLAQLLTLLGMAIVIMGGFAIVLSVLTPVLIAFAGAGAGAAGPILALAVSLFAMGAAIAVIVLSVAVLVGALSLVDGNIGLILISLAVGLLALGGALVVFGMMMTAALVPMMIGMGMLTAFAVVILIIGAAFLLFGMGVSLLANSFGTLIEALVLAGQSAEAIAPLGGLLLSLVVPLALFGIAALSAFPGILLFGLALSILNMVLIPLVGVLPQFVEALGGLSGLDWNSLGTGFDSFAGPLLKLGVAALIAAPGLLMLGIVFGIIGSSMSSFAAALPSLVESLGPLSEVINSMGTGLLSVGLQLIVFTGAMFALAAQIPLIVILGLATALLAKNIFNMGLGMKMFAVNVNTVIAGIKNLKDNISGMAGMSKQFVQEINKMKEAMADLANVKGFGIFALMKTIIQPMQSGGSSSSENPGADEGLMVRMDEAVEHLAAIANNTNVTNQKLDALITATNKKVAAFNPGVDAGLT